MSLSFLSEGKFIALGEIISKNLFFFYFLKNQKSTNYTPITSWSVFDEKILQQNHQLPISSHHRPKTRIVPACSWWWNLSRPGASFARTWAFIRQDFRWQARRLSDVFHALSHLFFPPDSFFNRMSAVCRMPACTTNWMMDLIEWWLSFMPRSSSQIENSLPKVWVW